MNESGSARAAGPSYAKAGRNFFRRMTKLEIAAIEKLNEGVVNLYAEGTFYKAYEQSAYILCTYVRPLKVSARPLKGWEGLLLSVGFPISALEKWTAGAEVSVVSDKALRLRIPRLIDMDGYAAWRASFQDSALVGETAAARHPRLSEEYYPVYGLCYRLTRDITALCSRLKRNYRYSLGEDLRQSMFGATVAITFASKRGQLAARASEAIECVERAQLALRLLNELKEISDERYVPFIDVTEDIKRQLEKWARSGQSSQKTAGVPAP